MAIKRLRQLKTKMSKVVICYARNGQRLFEGSPSEIPEELKDYYVSEKIVNRVLKKIYVEIIEDKYWFA